MSYMPSDTICALSSGGSNGAVAVIRLSGPHAREILNRTIARARAWEPRRQTFCTLLDGADVLDKALVTYFPAPHSFTGEDVVEFAVHGSPYIKGRLLELLCAYGARPARRGEFSQRAFLNGKLDLVEAQGICDVIAAGNKAAHQVAMSQLDGKLSARVNDLKTKFPQIADEWDYEMNGDFLPEQFLPGSEKSFYWKCNNGHIVNVQDIA